MATTAPERRVRGGTGTGAEGRGRRWTPATVPEQLALLGLACVPASFAYPRVSQALGLRLLCPLRELTGVPCPLCGMTTAATGLAGGDLPAALAANPFVLVLAAGTAIMALLMAARAAGMTPPARPWGRQARRLALVAVVLLAAASWAFQLHRYGLV
jgi:Protein of unknown function (DUF2752)